MKGHRIPFRPDQQAGAGQEDEAAGQGTVPIRQRRIKETGHQKAQKGNGKKINTKDHLSPIRVGHNHHYRGANQTKNDEVFRIAFNRTVDYLNSSKNVIFDATNISSYQRKRMLDYFHNVAQRENWYVIDPKNKTPEDIADEMEQEMVSC